MADCDCNTCGHRWVGPCTPCPECSGTSVNVQVKVTGASLGIATAAGQVGTVADEPATSEGPHRIRSETLLGARSSSEFDAEGEFTLRANGRSDVGQRGEGQVLRTLIEYFALQGIPTEEIKPHDEKMKQTWEASQIDAKLLVLGKEFNVQMTAVPQHSGHWRSASRGESVLVGGINDAVRMVHEALEKKRKASSSEMILVLDARHAGPVAEQRVIAEYKKIYGDPSDLGFAAIVVVGPTATLSALLASNIG